MRNFRKLISEYSSISGKAFGAGSGAARLFSVSLYGPDNSELYIRSTPFNENGPYTFTGLPNGKYVLRVGTRGDIGIGPHPSTRTVTCSGEAIKNVNFELK